MLRALLAVHFAMLLGGADAKPIEASQLVGTWEPSAPDMLTHHGQPRTDLRADHTCTDTSYGADGSTLAHGTWEVRGDELVRQFGKDLTVRETILEVATNHFKTRFSIDGRQTIFTYTRVKPES